MMAQLINIQATASQIVQCVLGGQNCQISIYQKSQGLFVDVNADGADISIAVLAHDDVPLVSRTYAGFIGNLIFNDLLGKSDPEYTNLGTRYQLIYLTDAEYAKL